MKKFVIGGLAIATVVIAAFVLAPRASAQRDRVVRQGQFDNLVIEGAGSSIGISVRELNVDDVAKTKVQQSDGVFVEDVRDGTPAARARRASLPSNPKYSLMTFLCTSVNLDSIRSVSIFRESV